ncbi:hypothetical protein D3C72_1024770 [compost metagenome]
MQTLTRVVVEHQQYADTLATPACDGQGGDFANAVQRQQTLLNFIERNALLFDFDHPATTSGDAERPVILKVQDIVER